MEDFFKELKKDQEIRKAQIANGFSVNLDGDLEKADKSGKVYGDPIGTIKTWQGKQYVKISAGKWVPHKEKSSDKGGGEEGTEGAGKKEPKTEPPKSGGGTKYEMGKDKKTVEGFSVGEMVELTPKYGISGVKMGTIKGFTVSKDKKQMAIVQNSAGKKITVPISGLIDRKPSK